MLIRHYAMIGFFLILCSSLFVSIALFGTDTLTAMYNIPPKKYHKLQGVLISP